MNRDKVREQLKAIRLMCDLLEAELDSPPVRTISSKVRAKALSFVPTPPNWIDAAGIAYLIGCSAGVANHSLSELAAQGKIVRVARGRYSKP